jgi:hypothetical protein
MNNEIRKYNRKLFKIAQAYDHITFTELDTNRSLFTKHGLHFNKIGKAHLAKQIASTVQLLLDRKTDPPLVLGWLSDSSINNDILVSATSTETTVVQSFSGFVDVCVLCKSHSSLVLDQDSGVKHKRIEDVVQSAEGTDGNVCVFCKSTNSLVHGLDSDMEHEKTEVVMLSADDSDGKFVQDSSCGFSNLESPTRRQTGNIRKSERSRRIPLTRSEDFLWATS